MIERRQNSKHLSREMFIRAQGWSTVELCAILDIVGSRLLKEDPVHGVNLVLQQTLNILRKKPSAVVPEAARPLADSRPAAAQDDHPEAASPEDGGCPPDAVGAIR